MMKNSSAPRSLYVRKSVAHVCFAGKLFGVDKSSTKIDASRPVRCVIGRKASGNVKVSQLSSVGGSISWTSEVWPIVVF